MSAVNQDVLDDSLSALWFDPPRHLAAQPARSRPHASRSHPRAASPVSLACQPGRIVAVFVSMPVAPLGNVGFCAVISRRPWPS